jgi:hypothetical protein
LLYLVQPTELIYFKLVKYLLYIAFLF